MRRGCIYRKLLTALRRLSDEIPTDVKQSVGIPSVLSNLKRLYNGHIYLSATVTWFVGNSSENSDGIPTTVTVISVNRNVVGSSSVYSDDPCFVGIPSEIADGIPTTSNLWISSEIGR